MTNLCQQLSAGTGLNFRPNEDDEPFAVGKYDYFLTTYSDGSINVGVLDAWDVTEIDCATVDLAIAEINAWERGLNKNVRTGNNK